MTIPPYTPNPPYHQALPTTPELSESRAEEETNLDDTGNTRPIYPENRSPYSSLS